MSKNVEFVQTVYNNYHRNNRNSTMPWRIDHNPYYVFLSEMMLQQTQVSRVVEYFNNFINLWPSVEQLANASLAEVLVQWQGLGYNRRAKYLHNCAKAIVSEYNGIIPSDEIELQKLPGIGTYTSAAIRVFAFNQPAIVVETNIRRVFIHWFFKDENDIKEQAIREKVYELIDREQVRIWYWALMDYGAFLTKHIKNPNRKSQIYTKQKKFHGSNRQLRGAIVRVLTSSSAQNILYDDAPSDNIHKDELVKRVLNDLQNSGLHQSEIQDTQIYDSIYQLEQEGLIACENETYYIPD